MQLCRDCGIKMTGVMSFSKDKHERFDRCPNCYSETKHRNINENELDFEEVLHKAINKRK